MHQSAAQQLSGRMYLFYFILLITQTLQDQVQNCPDGRECTWSDLGERQKCKVIYI